MQNDLASVYDGVFEVLSNLKANEPIPVGMLGKMYSALDKMRSARAPSQDIANIEQISVSIRRLELARRNRDSVAEQSLGERLDALMSNWMEMHPAEFEAAE
jgi:hypothetical protein